MKIICENLRISQTCFFPEDDTSLNPSFEWIAEAEAAYNAVSSCIRRILNERIRVLHSGSFASDTAIEGSDVDMTVIIHAPKTTEQLRRAFNYIALILSKIPNIDDVEKRPRARIAIIRLFYKVNQSEGVNTYK